MISLFSMMEYVGFDLFGQTDHTLSEKLSFRTFSYLFFTIFSSKKQEEEAFQPPFF